MLNKLLKFTPLVFLAILCTMLFVNSPTWVSPLATPGYQLEPSGLTRTFGPAPSWHQYYGGTNSEYSYGMAQCSDDGFVLVGYTYSYGAGNADVYLVRTDADGNMVWNKTYGGTNYDYGYDVVATSTGFVIAGYSRSYTASYDLWLIGTDANGDHLWNITYGGTSNDYVRAMIACSCGGYAITGYTYSFGAGNTDAWLVHTNATGGELWNTTFGGSNYDYGYDLVECTGGGYALAGYTRSYSANNDAWLIRTDASGNHLWNQTYDSSSYDYSRTLVECGSGGFALAGQTQGYGSIDYAGWLIRTDSSGNHVWNQTYDEAYEQNIDAMIEYSDGGFVLAGSNGGSPRKGESVSDGLLIRTDESGTMLWNRSYGGDNWDRYKDVVECSNGDIVATGRGYPSDNAEAWLAKTAYPLAFSPALADQLVPFNAPLNYDINVYSWFGTDTWTLNDTTHFTISTAGIVLNTLVLATGVYGLQVTVNDTLGHEITGEFTVTIESREFFPVFLPLILLIALIAIIIVILVYICYSRRES